MRPGNRIRICLRVHLSVLACAVVQMNPSALETSINSFTSGGLNGSNCKVVGASGECL